jgi:hypothetical protein
MTDSPTPKAGACAWADEDKLVQFEPGATGPELLAKVRKTPSWSLVPSYSLHTAYNHRASI